MVFLSIISNIKLELHRGLGWCPNIQSESGRGRGGWDTAVAMQSRVTGPQDFGASAPINLAMTWQLELGDLVQKVSSLETLYKVNRSFVGGGGGGGLPMYYLVHPTYILTLLLMRKYVFLSLFFFQKGLASRVQTTPSRPGKC